MQLCKTLKSCLCLADSIACTY